MFISEVMAVLNYILRGLSHFFWIPYSLIKSGIKWISLTLTICASFVKQY